MSVLATEQQEKATTRSDEDLNDRPPLIRSTARNDLMANTKDTDSHKKNETSSSLQQQQQQQKQQQQQEDDETLPRLRNAARKTAAVAHSVTPQGLLLWRVEQQYRQDGGQPEPVWVDLEARGLRARRQRKRAAQSMALMAQKENEESKPQQTTLSETVGPYLLTSDRWNHTKAPGQRFCMLYFNVLRSIIQLRAWWSFLLLPLLVFHPITAAVLVLGLTAVTTCLFGVVDILYTYIKGQDLRNVLTDYYDLVLDQWEDFKAGEGRTKWLLLAGVLLRLYSQS